MSGQKYHSMRDAYRAMYEGKKIVVGRPALSAAVVLPKPSITKVNIDVNPQTEKVGDVEKAYYAFPAGFDPTNREDVAQPSASKKVEYNKEDVEYVDERWVGRHGQFDTEYARSRSPGGKMISGDDKRSGAEYTHGRRIKVSNPGMQPDVGGKTKPKSQGRMDNKTRADLEYRKKRLKKEEIEISDEEFFNFMVENGITESVESAEAVYQHMSDDWFESLYEGLITEKKKGRCWTGYKPTPGKEPYSDGSCMKA